MNIFTITHYSQNDEIKNIDFFATKELAMKHLKEFADNLERYTEITWRKSENAFYQVDKNNTQIGAYVIDERKVTNE